MQTYIVLYRDADQPQTEEPLGFRCQAENGDHAEEQCANAYPEADIVWVWQGAEIGDALNDYYG